MPHSAMLCCAVICHAGSQTIPNNELDVARDLYASLQEFYRVHQQYKDRPMYITGEVRTAHSMSQQQQGWASRVGRAGLGSAAGAAAAAAAGGRGPQVAAAWPALCIWAAERIAVGPRIHQRPCNEPICSSWSCKL
jgi:hypothetical protein